MKNNVLSLLCCSYLLPLDCILTKTNPTFMYHIILLLPLLILTLLQLFYSPQANLKITQ